MEVRQLIEIKEWIDAITVLLRANLDYRRRSLGIALLQPACAPATLATLCIPAPLAVNRKRSRRGRSRPISYSGLSRCSPASGSRHRRGSERGSAHGCNGTLRSRNSASSADRLSAEETISTRLPMVSISRPNSQRRRGLRHPRRRADDAEAIAVILRAEDRERQRAARDGQDAVAGAMEDREHAGRAAAGEAEDRRADRMGEAGEPGRDQRMIAAEEARLEDARRHLRRADQRAGRTPPAAVVAPAASRCAADARPSRR